MQFYMLVADVNVRNSLHGVTDAHKQRSRTSRHNRVFCSVLINHERQGGDTSGYAAARVGLLCSSVVCLAVLQHSFLRLYFCFYLLFVAFIWQLHKKARLSFRRDPRGIKWQIGLGRGFHNCAS